MNKRILFVDDEPRILEGLEELLSRYRRKWEMVFVSSGSAALQKMRERPFDVIVTDMRMPEMDGSTLLRNVKDEHPGTVRIVLSGHAEMEATMRTVPVAHQFLHKPCDADVLEKTVERACDLQSLTTNESIKGVVGRIQRLPSLPTVYAALQRALADERSTAEDVARIIEKDLGMSAKVLQLVNSAFFCLARRITSIREAVLHLGYNRLQKLVLTAEVFQAARLDPSSGLCLEALRDHAVLTATIAQKILRKSRNEAEDAWAAGLLHDIGKLVIASELPAHLSKAIDRALQTGQPLWLAEQELYGVSHAEIGAYLLGVWGLPYSVLVAVANHHQPERVQHPGLDSLTAVYVADALANECGPNGDGAPNADLNSEYLVSLGLAGQLSNWREMAQNLALTTEQM